MKPPLDILAGIHTGMRSKRCAQKDITAGILQRVSSKRIQWLLSQA
jgi:hypothetical protein